MQEIGNAPVEILWRRRETRRQTEKTNLNLKQQKKPVYFPPKKNLKPSEGPESGGIRGQRNGDAMTRNPKYLSLRSG